MPNLTLGVLRPAIPGPNPAYQILVKTDNAGTSNNDQFTLPATGTYDIDWGDGTVDTGVSGEQTHTYASAGEYVIKVTGGLTAITFGNGGDRLKLLEIQNWGNIGWTTMSFAYYGCSNMQGTFTDVPDLSAVNSLRGAFRGCTVFNGSVGGWDTSGVSNMRELFRDTSAFNQDIGSWDVSSVTDMRGMFFGATAFDQNLGAWNVSSVTNMGLGNNTGMFQGASAFNNGGSGDIGNWNITSVATIQGVFQDATSFNQPIGSWNTSSVTNIFRLFDGATAFNQDISGWDISSVTTMGAVFQGANAFQQPLNTWAFTGSVNISEFMLNKTGANSYNTADYDDLLVQWDTLVTATTLAADRTVDMGGAKYTDPGAGATARANLITAGWTIVDGGPV